jgi:hypothetical protein
MNLPKLSPALEYDIISSIIDAVGQPVTLTYITERIVCTACGGNDPFCSVCHGNPTIDTIAEKIVQANIKWKGSDQKIYRPEGQFVEGDCLINFTVNGVDDYITTDALLKQVTSVTVDNRICTVTRWYFRGSPINRVYLVLVQDENIGGQRIG